MHLELPKLKTKICQHSNSSASHLAYNDHIIHRHRITRYKQVSGIQRTMSLISVRFREVKEDSGRRSLMILCICQSPKAPVDARSGVSKTCCGQRYMIWCLSQKEIPRDKYRLFTIGVLTTRGGALILVRLKLICSTFTLDVSIETSCCSQALSHSTYHRWIPVAY